MDFLNVVSTNPKLTKTFYGSSQEFELILRDMMNNEEQKEKQLKQENDEERNANLAGGEQEGGK